jgi:hypothetical protein
MLKVYRGQLRFAVNVTSKASGQSVQANVVMMQWTICTLHSLWCSRLWQGSQVLRQKRTEFQLSLRLFLVYWNIMAARVHRPLTVVAFNADGIGRQTHELRKQMQDLKIDVALFTDTHLKPHMRYYIPNYHIYRNDRQDGYKGGTAVAVKKGIPHTYLCWPASPPFSRSNGGLHTDWTYWNAACICL